MIKNDLNTLMAGYSLTEEEIIQVALGTMRRCIMCDSIKPIHNASNWCKECFDSYCGEL